MLHHRVGLSTWDWQGALSARVALGRQLVGSNDLNLQNVGVRRAATLFVVDDIVKPGNRILWVAGLTGGCITRPDRDQWLVYTRALGWQRFVWLSPGFKRASPASAQIIQSLIRHASVPRRWRLIADHAEVAAALWYKARLPDVGPGLAFRAR